MSERSAVTGRISLRPAVAASLLAHEGVWSARSRPRTQPYFVLKILRSAKLQLQAPKCAFLCQDEPAKKATLIPRHFAAGIDFSCLLWSQSKIAFAARYCEKLEPNLGAALDHKAGGACLPVAGYLVCFRGSDPYSFFFVGGG